MNSAALEIHLSAACSMDGYMSDTSKERLILSSPEDLADIESERAGYDAILVGAGTLRSDDPFLDIRDIDLSTNRKREGMSPHLTRVTLTTSGNLDPNLRFFRQDDARRIILCPDAQQEALAKRFTAPTEVIGISGTITAGGVARTLKRAGINSLFVEGGPHLLSMFLAEGVFNCFRLATAPFFLGDMGGARLRALPGTGKTACLPIVSVRQLGHMTVVDYGCSPTRPVPDAPELRSSEAIAALQTGWRVI